MTTPANRRAVSWGSQALAPEWFGSAQEEWAWLSEAEGWPDRLAHAGVRGGVLELRPGTSVWWGAFHAPFLFRLVEGDFVVHTRLRTLGLHSDFPVRPDSGSLAGLLVRAPGPPAGRWTPRDERYWSLTTGLASGPGGAGPSMEITTTTRGESGIEWFAGRAGWVELAAARLGGYLVACTASRANPGPSPGMSPPSAGCALRPQGWVRRGPTCPHAFRWASRR